MPRFFAGSKLECTRWRVFPPFPPSLNAVSLTVLEFSEVRPLLLTQSPSPLSLPSDPLHRPFQGCASPSPLFLLMVVMCE